MKQSIGVDIGGTKVAVAIINNKGEIVSRRQAPSEVESAETLFEQVVRLINEELNEHPFSIEMEGIGIGLPGKVDVENGIAVFQNNIPWPNFPIVKRLQEVYGNIPVKIDNDVKVAAYAEYRLQNLTEKEMFAYVTLSTGIAATNIVHNEILRGAGFSGEIGFIPVHFFDQWMSLEEACSGVGIQKKAQELYQDTSVTTKDVFERWRQDDEIATDIIRQAASGIASSLHAMICLLDPHVIVFGGSVSNYNPDYIELVKEILDTRLHAEQKHVLERLFTSTIKGDNGIIGAGLLVL